MHNCAKVINSTHWSWWYIIVDVGVEGWRKGRGCGQRRKGYGFGTVHLRVGCIGVWLRLRAIPLAPPSILTPPTGNRWRVTQKSRLKRRFCNNLVIQYRIARNFRGVQFLRMASLQNFRGLIFADASDHAHYTLYNRTYFIFVDSRLSTKTGPQFPAIW
jgi:hypothetical protein